MGLPAHASGGDICLTQEAKPKKQSASPPFFWLINTLGGVRRTGAEPPLQG